MNYKDVINTFNEKRIEIWEKMPHDVYDLSEGIVPGDTNVYGQYVMTALYADSELRTLCDEVLFYIIETAKQGNVDTKTLVKFAENLLDYKAKFFEFTGVPIASKMLFMYIDALKMIENLDELIELSEAALMYFNRHHMWVDLIIPWGVFNGFAKTEFAKYL